jgi:hypothetical protein
VVAAPRRRNPRFQFMNHAFRVTPKLIAFLAVSWQSGFACSAQQSQSACNAFDGLLQLCREQQPLGVIGEAFTR